MRVLATRVIAGIVSAWLAAALGPATSSADTAGSAPSASATTPAPPAAIVPDSAPATTAPAPTTTAPAAPIDPMSPLVLDDPNRPRAVEDTEQPVKAPPKPRKPKASKERDAKPANDPPAAGAAASAGADAAALAAMPADAPAGIPSYFIDSFRIPIFLLPILQAAGTEYGVRWEILAAINEIETDYGRNLNVSSAGATGWMQFMPATWAAYGVDANRDGRADPSNPADAIFAAARYLQAAGSAADLRKAVFAYNHADWYVDSVLQRAQRLAALPADLVSALSGLAQGRSPVLGPARALAPAGTTGERRRSLNLRVRDKAAAVAVTDVTVVRIGRSQRLGRFVRVRDVYGNHYTYGRLASVVRRYPVLRRNAPKPAAPTAPGRKLTGRDLSAAVTALSALAHSGGGAAGTATAPSTAGRATTPGGPLAATDWAAQARRLRAATAPPATVVRPRRPVASSYDRRLLGDVAAERVRYTPLREGSRVVAGTILGHAGTSSSRPARVRFEIRPAGKRTPRIDPAPILAGWKLLRASAPSLPAVNPTHAQTSIGQVLLLGKPALQRLVLDNPRITIYPCGRDDIGAGRIDRRVLATLQLLAMSDLRPTVSSLQCGHSRLTASGNVSEHWSGNAVDISAINGVPILGHQGAGSIAETTIRRLLTLQGTMRPHQIISLMTFAGAANTLALADHADHIHVGFAPTDAAPSLNARLFDGVLEPKAWQRLVDRLAAIDNPRVSASPPAAATTP